MVQYLRVVYGGRDKKDVFDGILYHFLCYLLKDNVSHLQANTFHQTKMALCVRQN
jgi:hypothetical protein